MKPILFFDAEINPNTKQILDVGAVDSLERKFHATSLEEFSAFAEGYEFVGGHNILACDLKYVESAIRRDSSVRYVDTLYLSPLLFPAKPYHRLVKNDKLQSDSLSNPLDDAIKSKELFYDEINAFESLQDDLKQLWFLLLRNSPEFSGFFAYLDYAADRDLVDLIRTLFHDKVCANAHLEQMAQDHPIALAYSLALIAADDRGSITPQWVQINYPIVDEYMRVLRNQPCDDDECAYCKRNLNVKRKLKEIFGYDSFRTYEGEPLQERAVEAATRNKSLLAIFPTGGGKSITFQLPAIMAGENAKGLTVVISPLQSLMKDQVDNLAKFGIADAVTINGLLSPIERKEAIERVADGVASLLYISPESLRSPTVEKLLLSRNVVRFVVDEAHCFSAWGQDFRVDYLYIGTFIKQLQEKKQRQSQIPVSCFTATAKRKVVEDICDYFKTKLNLDLELFESSATRTNLRYKVLFQRNEAEKYETLRRLVEEKNCPTIVYVSRTKRAVQIATKLTADGFEAKPFHGKMESSEKIENQDAFISDKVRIIVSTSAFGMGVDKKDVGLVVHYDISDSLENYVQEAGRAGRDPSLTADCYILFNENDLDKHFIRLNQTKLNQSEIQQIWTAIKRISGKRASFSRSALEIAREAGWNEDGKELETRVKTAIAALENAGYIRRGMNFPHVYATGIMVKNMEEAYRRIHASGLFDEKKAQKALDVIRCLISKKGRSEDSDLAESRIDYLADILALSREDVVEAVNFLREEEIIADSQDMSAYIMMGTQRKSNGALKRFLKLEELLLDAIANEHIVNLKEINEQAERQKIRGASVKALTTILFYWTIRGYIQKSVSHQESARDVTPTLDDATLRELLHERSKLAAFFITFLYDKSIERPSTDEDERFVSFSVLELQKAYNAKHPDQPPVSMEKVQDALLYLSKIEALSLEGGFLVLYQTMNIRRVEMDNRIHYKRDDYKQLDEFYKQKVQMIHIVGEYARKMARDETEAASFVKDYFQSKYKTFLTKYFNGDRLEEINRNVTPQKFNELMGKLSERQLEIVNDDASQYVVVAAGPGSGKTMLLAHKLAALVMLDDVKYEQLLMLTFSRAAATEFKARLIELIGNAAMFVEIKTFHSYCFDVIGKIGSIENSKDVVERAVKMIREKEVEQSRITKSIVVIDEAQDMDKHEFDLICALMENNPNMRVVAVGDDDQNIFEFRGSDSGYMRSLITNYGARQYELTDNYRSAPEVVALANRFVQSIQGRMKTEEIRSVRQDPGVAQIIRHKSPNMEYPIVESLIGKRAPDKTICVLTCKNDEALRVVGLLRQMKIPTRLIQSNEGFSLYELAEFRLFLKLTQKESASPIISDSQWENALAELKRLYGMSRNLDLVLRMLKRFSQVNEKKYRSDLEAFIHESQTSDFVASEKGEIVVSTIHKSKGREFDCVYMLLNNTQLKDNESRRALYVGMTRAKSELYLHCNTGALDAFSENITEDQADYPEPSQAILQLTHRDVVLKFFKDKKNFILKQRAGASLTLIGKTFYIKDGERLCPIAMLSRSAAENLNRLVAKGYRVRYARIRYIVAWRDIKELDDKEYAVVLPDVVLEKNT